MEKEEAISTLKMLTSLFPLKDERELKIYGIVSVAPELRPYITNNNILLIVNATYDQADALAMNEQSVHSLIGPNAQNWAKAIVMTSIPFPALVPVDKIAEMVRKIKDLHVPPKEVESKLVVETKQLVSHAQYLFNIASATQEEFDMLQKVCDRFVVNVKKSTLKKVKDI